MWQQSAQHNQVQMGVKPDRFLFSGRYRTIDRCAQTVGGAGSQFSASASKTNSYH
jgi:hypothetical protein